MNTLAVFRSRSQALAVYRALSARKIACTVINTPSRFGVGCGLSVVFPAPYKQAVTEAIRTLSADGFVGFFLK